MFDKFFKKEKPLQGLAGLGGGFARFKGGGSVSVSGGTAIPDGSYTIRVFTSPGTLSISGGTLDVEYLVVGGGGAGGSGGGPGGGGGGAGGMLSGSGYTLPADDHSITVGDGGTWELVLILRQMPQEVHLNLAVYYKAGGGGHGGQHNINSTGPTVVLVVVVEVVTIVSLEVDLAELEIGKPILALLFQHKEILEVIVLSWILYLLWIWCWWRWRWWCR